MREDTGAPGASDSVPNNTNSESAPVSTSAAVPTDTDPFYYVLSSIYVRVSIKMGCTSITLCFSQASI